MAKPRRRQRSFRKIREAMRKRDVLWHIFRHAAEPWKSQAIRRLIGHEDLEVAEALELLPLAETPAQIQKLFRFLWDWDREAFLKIAQYKNSAWDFLENVLKSAPKGPATDCLIGIIRDDPKHRKRAWEIFQELDLPKEWYRKILALPDWDDLKKIKIQAAKRIGTPNGPDKIAQAIVEKSRKGRA